MAGEMSSANAIAAPLSPEDLNRLFQAGSLSLEALSTREVTVGMTEGRPLDDLTTTPREGRLRARQEPIAECLKSLRGDLREFVKVNNREPEAFGLGMRGGEPLDCSAIMRRVGESVTRLEMMSEDRGSLSPLALAQRSVVPQVTAVLEEFLVDLTSTTKRGEVNQSEIVPVLKACINLSRVLGEVVQALATMKMELAEARGRP